jgi:hypothetical protein
MAKKYFERRSLATALSSYLIAKGWNITGVVEGYDTTNLIEPPTVAIVFMPTRFREFQMGRNRAAFERRVQIHCYMESEARADAITDDIGDFIDEQVITVLDNSGNETAKMLSLTDSIELEVVAPREIADPLWKHWRGIIRTSYEVYYVNEL